MDNIDVQKIHACEVGDFDLYDQVGLDFCDWWSRRYWYFCVEQREIRDRMTELNHYLQQNLWDRLWGRRIK